MHLQDKEYFGKVDLDKARAYAKNEAPRKKNSKGEFEPFDFNCNISEFGRYGAGTQLYFRFLKFFAWVFLLMFLISYIAIDENMQGTGLQNEDNPPMFATTTIANHPKWKVPYLSVTATQSYYTE